MLKFSLLLIVLFSLTACEYFKQDDPRTPIARVNESYLYEEDISELITETTSREDSILIVNNYINRWATQQLLIDQAKINLATTELENFDKLVDQYKTDLYTEAYKNVIVAKQLDSSISENAKQEYYESNKENFRLNDELVKVRYVHVDENFADLRQLEEDFKRFDAEEKIALNELSIKFKSFNLNDSIWVKKETLVQNLPVLQSASSQVLKKSNFTRLQDSLGVYLVKIEDLLERNDVAPLSFVSPTIEQILINQRKLELIKKLEKDITKDAIKNKKFETYTPQ
ncbi:MAG: peptidyl-prolyl cis-trans isomerase [Flavobacteriaceae bacterium]|nr:peptidyl-prolyl cis-trans isomerase [Flavobacteriaceae bacterium]